MNAPVLIKGHISLEREQTRLEFVHRELSPFGVLGLPWPPLNPTHDFGKRVQVHVRALGPDRTLAFRTDAIIIREKTARASHMGLQFILSEQNRKNLSDFILKNGFYPKSYTRKYPRIPSQEQLRNFPLHASGMPLKKKGYVTEETERHPLLFDVKNISPGGILLSTENPNAAAIRPSTDLKLVLDPRGQFTSSIEIKSTVCRVQENFNLTNKNRVRLFGVKLTQISPKDKIAFHQLLKEIIGQIKTN